MTAKRGERVLGGEVRVDAGAPPRALRVEVRDGRPRARDGVRRAHRPGGREGAPRVGRRGRRVVRDGERATASCVVTLAEPLTGPDALVVEGVTDRAADPTRSRRSGSPSRSRAGPGAATGLVFVVRDRRRPDPRARRRHAGTSAPSASCPAVARATTRTVRCAPCSGWFEAEDLPKGFAGAFRKAERLHPRGHGVAREQERRRPAHPRLLRRRREQPEPPPLPDGRRPDSCASATSEGKREHGEDEVRRSSSRGKPNHLLVSYRPGRLVAYQDGHAVFDTDAIHGDLSGWRDGTCGSCSAPIPDGEHDFSWHARGRRALPALLRARGGGRPRERLPRTGSPSASRCRGCVVKGEARRRARCCRPPSRSRPTARRWC